MRLSISVIPFTVKRERDTGFHLLQNATVKNIIDCKQVLNREF